MENRKQLAINRVERILVNSELSKEQRDTLSAFDRFNEMEAKASLKTRENYLQSLYDLGMMVQKPYEQMNKEDI
jgi:hypothetical protein